MRSTRLLNTLMCVMISGALGCTGTITGTGLGGGDDTPGDDDTPLPGQPDAAPPLPGQPDAAPPRPGEPDAAPPTPEPTPLAIGVHIDEIALLQSVSVPIARKGAEVTSRNAPIVEGRDGLFAITYEVDGGFTARPIEARVIIDGTLFKTQATISGSSGDAPTGALKIKVPGSAIKTSSSFEVSLHEVEGANVPPGSADNARYPASGTTSLDAVSVNGALHLVLVPFRYNADGSGRLPPIDAAAVEAHRTAFRAMYPVADVDVTVHAPVDTNITIQSDDSWGQWLNALRTVRQNDDPPSNTYYYGLASPATSFGTFCNGGCIVGLGNVPGANNSSLFTAVGVSFTNRLLSDTALHEIGHTMGRSHIDCGGATGIDPNFPYDNGSIGTWGYDASADQLKSPALNQSTDIMGYCDNQWISDYEYKAIFNRLSQVNASSARITALPQTYRVGRVDANGTVIWESGFVTLRQPLEGGFTQVSLRDSNGAELGLAGGQFFPYDHLRGGTLYLPIDGLLDTASLAPGGFTRLP
jgi:hypothetical protein